ncbi:hypothetical protein ALISP_3275 [Alicycliphilus sp. B1]|nr:hypothetical protein ALISP_3275 [Alicycliphilus sp. B1]
MQMRFLWLSGALLAAVLAGCAGSQRLVPKVEQGQAEGGAKTVTVASESVACSRPQCPVLAAAWTSAKAGQAVLTVGLPYQKAEVTGADFHFGGSQTVHVRSRSRADAPALGFPATAFDVPLGLIGQIAYAPRSWVRVHTADGRSVDETLNSGDQRGRAVEAMSYFLAACGVRQRQGDRRRRQPRRPAGAPGRGQQVGPGHGAGRAGPVICARWWASVAADSSPARTATSRPRPS